MDYKIGRVLISKEELDAKIEELAARIRHDYAGQTLVCICVLRGAVVFFTDLMKAIGPDVNVKMDFLAISSYGSSTKSSGVVKIQKDLSEDIHGENVMIVEDIYDTGLSLTYIKKLISERNPKSLSTCVLLDKVEKHTREVPVEYKGFDIPDEFVIGYGLDYAEKFRQLKQVHIAVPVEEK